MIRPIAASLAFSMCCSIVSAQEAGETPQLSLDPEQQWRAEITPIVWFSSLSGDLTIAPGQTFTIEEFNADEPSYAAGAEARIDSERFSFSVGGFHREDSDEGAPISSTIRPGDLTLPAGTRTDWDIELTGIKATGAYRFDPLVENDRVTLAFDVYAGLRYFDLNIRIDAPAGSTAFDEQWALPLLGTRMRLDLPYDFEGLVELDAGFLPLGETSAFSWEIFAGLSYHPTPNVALRAGFRHLSINYLDETDAGDNEFQGFLAGLYVGAVIRF